MITTATNNNQRGPKAAPDGDQGSLPRPSAGHLAGLSGTGTGTISAAADKGTTAAPLSHGATPSANPNGLVAARTTGGAPQQQPDPVGAAYEQLPRFMKE
jgi:hypothetical protein